MISVTSTWDAVAANGSSNALQSSIRTVSAKETNNFKFDADSMVDFESCAQLTKPSNCHEKCNLMITSKHLPLSRIILVSESKRAEICDGKTKEYKFTKPGELLDDSDPDMIMFKNVNSLLMHLGNKKTNDLQIVGHLILPFLLPHTRVYGSSHQIYFYMYRISVADSAEILKIVS